jgi:hypothetical protein
MMGYPIKEAPMPTEFGRPSHVRRRLSQVDFAAFMRDIKSGPVDVPAWRDTDDLLRRARIKFPDLEIIDRTEQEIIFAL